MFDQPMLIAHKYVPQDKFDDHRVYVQQQHTVQIIQLVEAPAPPQRNLGSAIDSSYCSSSSYSESSSLASEEEEEVVCESYCSSDDEEVQDTRSCPPDTYSLRMKRILSWRENFSAHLSATLSEPTLPSSLKRKLSLDDDTASQTSKRSRSQGPSSVSSLGLHSCPACDATFDTEQSLREHGKDDTANEACSAAVEYAFE
ncbi:hypothetical protein AGABI1DRAFT_55411 [Agaricus bisporus var. burnettii JB137-S8]|uniref:Uncharacterized protein n=2 Tax=Agaricus bisporus var. burnettii TaxID=192524 RepID=K5X322_AGABU|nr:uncharacterized protein AGABI1DRAFT_55411 [Agaricus bisporus var. burnettii JB137-S8]EKM82216.1 hypothetical protein AGABI1DRAFT_55411 [Agaricus bisporus var. burnettii JB137-S8]KAF7770732.1 hypothetical protein Agabi119p4_6706 [Agaricus bisporus var. burnettii]